MDLIPFHGKELIHWGSGALAGMEPVEQLHWSILYI